MSSKTSWGTGILRALGLVFGDIGTSPIYTLTVVVALTVPTEAHILGVLSLIVWTLTLLVTVEYAWLAMSLGKRGEGGTIVLSEILTPLLKSGRQVAFVTFLTYIGISLIIGDGVITPAISILSAVEGLLLIPGLEGVSTKVLILIAGHHRHRALRRAAQGHGEGRRLRSGRSWSSGSSVLAVSGLASIVQMPSVLKALNPLNAVHFLAESGLAGFFILSEVILCATGGEALYADMGHLKREHIIHAWYFVFVALVINYLGQGSFVIRHPDATNVLFQMVFDQARPLYIPFLVLSVIATVIASQAMISGMFSIVYQGITTRIMPMFKVELHLLRAPVADLHRRRPTGSCCWRCSSSWSIFKESKELAAAYGLAVTGTMTHHRHHDDLDLPAAGPDRPDGGRGRSSPSSTWPTCCPTPPRSPTAATGRSSSPRSRFAVILVYREGQKKLYRELRPLPLDVFLLSYEQIYRGAEQDQRHGAVLRQGRAGHPAVHRPHDVQEQHHLRGQHHRLDRPAGRPLRRDRLLPNPLEPCESRVPSSVALAPGLRSSRSSAATWRSSTSRRCSRRRASARRRSSTASRRSTRPIRSGTSSRSSCRTLLSFMATACP